jgi:hypothetical protein
VSKKIKTSLTKEVLLNRVDALVTTV